MARSLRSALAISLVLAVVPAAIRAKQWTLLGPWGGRIVRIVPGARPEVLFATSNTAVYRTTDGGDSWKEIAAIPFPQIAFDPRNSRLFILSRAGLYALPELSTPGTPIPPLLPGTPAPEPQLQHVPVPGGCTGLSGVDAGGAVWVTNSSRTMMKSANLGKSWTEIQIPGQTISFAIVFDPADPNVEYALTEHLLKTTDGGASWRAIEGPINGRVGTLAIDRTSPERIFAATQSGALHVSADGGTTWSDARSSGQTGQSIVALAASGTPERTLWAVYPSAAVGVSHDDGMQWEVSAPIMLAVNSIQSVDATGASSPVCFIGGSRGILRSRDGGRTWEEAHRGVSAVEPFSIAIAPDAPQTLCVSGGYQAHLSRDGGATWWTLPLQSSVTGPCAFGGNGNTLYVPAGLGFHMSSDGGASWRAVGMSDVWGVLALAVDPASSTTIYVVAEHINSDWSKVEKALYKTTDGGRHWKMLKDGLPCASVTVDPSRPSNIYLCSWMSTDGGSHWNSPDVPLLGILPGHPSLIYAAAQHHTLMSATSGTNFWLSAESGLPPQAFVTSVTWDRLAAKLYATMSTNRIFVSADRGSSWREQPLSQWSETIAVPPQRIAAEGDMIYVATDRGVYALSVEPEGRGRRRAVR